MSKVLRTVKNVVKNCSIPEVKTREATSNDPWFASTVELDELAQHTYHPKSQHEIYQILYKRLNDHPKYWRHVLKSLIVFEYLSFHGHDDIYRLLTTTLAVMNSLTTFMFVDKDGKDKGNFIRERAKRMVRFIEDPTYFKNEKEKSLKTRQRVTNNNPFPGSSYSRGSPTGSLSLPNKPDYAPRTQEEEDLQLQLALAISKQEAQEVQTQTQQSESNDSDSDRFDAFSSHHYEQEPKHSAISSNKSIAKDSNKNIPQPQLIDVFSEEFDLPNNVPSNKSGSHQTITTQTNTNDDFFNVFASQSQQPFIQNNPHMSQPKQGFSSVIVTQDNDPFGSYNTHGIQSSNTFSHQTNTYHDVTAPQQINNDKFDDFIHSPSPFESVASNLNTASYAETPVVATSHTTTNKPDNIVNTTSQSEAFQFVHNSGLVDLSTDAFRNIRPSQRVEKKCTLNELAKNNSSCESFATGSQCFTPTNPMMQNPNAFNVGQPPMQYNNTHNPFMHSSQGSLSAFSNTPQIHPAIPTTNPSYPNTKRNPFDDDNDDNKKTGF